MKSERRASKQNATGAWLGALNLPAAILLECECCPVGLWSLDRCECLLSSATIALLGFHGDEFSVDRELWRTRLESRDRRLFDASWKSLEKTRTQMVCRYRFTPKGCADGVAIEETAWLVPGDAAGRPAVLSRYRPLERKPHITGSEPSPFDRFAHQIGNNLQAIRGEADLLLLCNDLPQRSYDAIVRGIDNIQHLIANADVAQRNADE